MFDKEYSFTGKHALYVAALGGNIFDSNSKQKPLFKTYVDIYMVAPLLGVLYDRRAVPDKSNPETKKVFLEALVSRKLDLEFILQTVLLNDRTIDDEDKRIENAFKNIYSDTLSEDLLKLFNEYVLGGVEILYENSIDQAKSHIEALSNFNAFISEFNKIFPTSTFDNQNIFDSEELG